MLLQIELPRAVVVVVSETEANLLGYIVIDARQDGSGVQERLRGTLDCNYSITLPLSDAGR